MQKAGDHHLGFVKPLLLRDLPPDIRHAVRVLDPVRLGVRMGIQVNGRIKSLLQKRFRLFCHFSVQHVILPSKSRLVCLPIPLHM